MADIELDIERLTWVVASASYGTTVLMMCVIGVHVFMAVYGLFVFRETVKERREGRAIYILASFLITAFSMFSCALDTYCLFVCLFEAPSPMGFRATSTKYAGVWQRILSACCAEVVTMIGDGLLMYRCFVIWKRRPAILVLPILTFFASLALGIVTIKTTFFRKEVSKRHAQQAAWIFLKVSVNVMVTALISFRLLSKRRGFSDVLPKSQLAMYGGIVTMLVESALPLSATGIAFAILLIVAPERPTSSMLAFESYEVAHSALLFLWVAFSGLAPHMIIFRITTNRSWAHRLPREGPTAQTLSQSMRFGPPPASVDWSRQSQSQVEEKCQLEQN